MRFRLAKDHDALEIRCEGCTLFGPFACDDAFRELDTPQWNVAAFVVRRCTSPHRGKPPITPPNSTAEGSLMVCSPIC